MLPPSQLPQLPHLTFAVMTPLLTPLPSSTLMSALLLYSGMTCPVPNLGLTVTLFPSAEV